jgi:HTH-type transcriptional regulator / antitoxin HipB
MKDRQVPQYGIVTSIADLGKVIRAKRKSLGMTQERAAGLSGVGVRFLSELERGKTTAAAGKVFQVAKKLGLELYVEPKGKKGTPRKLNG